eukprot:TRINITY_DN26862_c0_g1_i1.p1 TRINITY_DN26862_c0_g1~~TRINITY_DN26862_c0_g1_i1.p1  ORF type:complete len:100 (+),score=5.34 TRINITY_DN26862_c0_g1_i1:586-885(+)
MVHKEMGLGSISIGEPFFNKMFAILLIPFAILMGIGPLLRWKQIMGILTDKLLLCALASIVVTSAWLFLGYAVVVYLLTLLATYFSCVVLCSRRILDYC